MSMLISGSWSRHCGRGLGRRNLLGNGGNDPPVLFVPDMGNSG